MAVSHVLFPTDFSEYSDSAIEYGIHLVNILNVKNVTILHSYATNNAIANQPIISAGLPELLLDEQRQLNRLKERVQSQVADDVAVSVLLVEGKLINIAHDLISSKGIDLIVLGISTKTKLEQSIIGSNAINVMRKTKCPVVIVPDKAAWIDNPNIAVAIDITHNANHIPIEKVKKFFAQIHGSKLSLVNTEDEDDHNTHIQNPNIEKINYSFSDLNTKLEILSSPNKLQALESYSSNKSINLLVLFERKYGILNTIFHTSLIRQIAYQTHIPILVIEELPAV